MIQSKRPKLTVFTNINIQKDKNLQSKLFPYCKTFSTIYPDNKTLIFTTDDSIIAIFQLDVAFNIASLSPLYIEGYSMNYFFDDIINYLLSSIKHLDFSLINLIGFRLYIYTSTIISTLVSSGIKSVTILNTEIPNLTEFVYHFYVDKNYQLISIPQPDNPKKEPEFTWTKSPDKPIDFTFDKFKEPVIDTTKGFVWNTPQKPLDFSFEKFKEPVIEVTPFKFDMQETSKGISFDSIQKQENNWNKSPLQWDIKPKTNDWNQPQLNSMWKPEDNS